MNEDSQPVAEPEHLEKGEGPYPDRIEISREQRDRLYIDGCAVVSNGRIFLVQNSVAAFKPFPKSKTGFTIEVQFRDSLVDKGCRTVRKPIHATATARYDFINYSDMVVGPMHMANYRGKRVMGILYSRIIRHNPRTRSLDYTLFLAPEETRKQ